MGWFKDTFNNIIKKIASKEEILNKALQQIQQGIPSFQIANNFIREMGQIDPNFSNSPEANEVMGAMGNPENLTLVLTNLVSAPQQTEQLIEQIPAQSQIEQPTEVSPEEVSLNPEGVNDAATTTDTEVSEEGIIGDEEVLTKQLEVPPSFNERISSDPTLLETFELPVSQIKTARNKLATINKKLRDMYYPEIKIEFSGEAYNKPVHYQNRTIQEPYIQVSISGTLPSPSEEISIKKQESVVQRDGSIKIKTVGTEPKGVRLIAKIIHKELDDQTQLKYLQTLDSNSPLRSVIESARASGETPFFNVVEPLDGAPPIDGKFWYSSPQECMACKVKKAGATARKSTYVGIVVPPEQMVPKTANINGTDTILTRKVMNKKTKQLEDQPIRIIPNELIENSPQEQFGGKCIDPFDATKTITALKNWVKNTKKVKEEYEKKKSKSRHKGGGWGTRSLPTESLLAVAVNMLRDERYRNNPDYSARMLASKTGWYQRTLRKDEEDKRSNYYNLRATRNSPYITDEDKKISAEVANWWRGRLGGIDIQNEDKNKITLSVVPDIGLKPANMRDVIGMVKTYLDQNNIQLNPAQKRPEDPKPEPIIEEPVIEKPIIEEPVIKEPVIKEPNVEGPGVIDNISEIEEGNAFVAKLKFTGSRPFRKGNRTNYVNEFKGPDGSKYIYFTNNEAYDAQEGAEIYIRGIKGPTNKRYRNTQIKQLQTVSPYKIQEYGETTIPETPVAQDQTVVPEAPFVPEAPVQKELNPIEKATERAKRVIQTGNTADGKKMTPEQLIPLYVDILTKNVPGIREQDYLNSLNTSYERGGQEGLMRYLDTIPAHLKNYIR